DILTEAKVFGGQTLTATDIVVAAGRASIGSQWSVADLSAGLVRTADERMQQMLEEAVDRMKTGSGDVVVIMVGGGAILARDELQGAGRLLVPEQSGVANAVGAAIAQVGGEVDRVVSFDDEGREQALERVKAQAIEQAVAAGASADSTRVVDVEEIPLAYVPGHSVRVRVKAVGDLAQEAQAVGAAV
ncbi:MAG: hydantoinase/oxoprolinase family protein, partial [Pseudomonadota bacterium]